MQQVFLQPPRTSQGSRKSRAVSVRPQGSLKRNLNENLLSPISTQETNSQVQVRQISYQEVLKLHGSKLNINLPRTVFIQNTLPILLANFNHITNKNEVLELKDLQLGLVVRQFVLESLGRGADE